MKNILITFTNAIDPTTGGVERVYHNLVPYFREHGYNVFATYQRKTDYDKNSVYTKAIFMEYSIDNVGYFDKLDKVMMEMAVDIVICPFPSYQLFNYCSRLIDKKVFFHVHNVPSKLMYPSSAKLPNILKESFVDRCLKRIRFDLRYLASFRRIELNMTQSDLASKMGYADKSMIAKIEKGVIDLPQSKIIAFAKVLNTAPGILMGLDGTSVDQPSLSEGIKIKIYGRVAAGIPLEAIEDVIDEEEIPEELARTGEFFGLRISGDSMEPDIHNGDTVIVKRQNDAESDEIVIALVNGNDGVCKRLKKYADSIALISLNPNYEPMYFSREEIDEKPVRIIGKVVELRRKF